MELAQFQNLSDEDLPIAAEKLRRAQFKIDPAYWLKKKLKEHFWSKQKAIADSVVVNRYTAVQSCHDVGKSFSAARIAAWWLDTHKPGEAFVVSTAPTFAQVRTILWREIGQAHRKGDLPGRVNQTEWYINDEIVGFGRKPADYDPAAFQGIHARYVLVILDEACGIPEALWDAADTLVTNDDSRILAIGNPDDPMSHFSKVCAPGSGWNVLTISAFDSPNFTGEVVPEGVQHLLISPVWVEEREARWGKKSPLYISKVLGEFPEDAENGVIPLSWIRRCQEVIPEGEEICLGLDVGASVGGDETVCRETIGNKPGREWTMRSDEAEEIVGMAIKAIHESGATSIKVDTIGVGWAIGGWLETRRKEGVHKARVIKVNVATKSSEPKRFANLRSQLWWNVRELIEHEALALGDLDDETIGELIAPKYALNSTGLVVVEPKDETKKRIERSPDHADALLLALYKDRRPADVAFPTGTI